MRSPSTVLLAIALASAIACTALAVAPGPCTVRPARSFLMTLTQPPPSFESPTDLGLGSAAVAAPRRLWCVDEPGV